MKRRRPAVMAFTLALAVVGAALLTNVVPYKQILDQRAEVAAAAAALEALEHDNEILTTQRDALETPVEIERLAREKLGYVRPGEVAYVVLEPPASLTSTIPRPVAEPELPEDVSLLESIWEFLTGADVLG
ncbi:hypothetical protein BH23ACT5_BH23ACT5_15240 [soil metagenome]